MSIERELKSELAALRSKLASLEARLERETRHSPALPDALPVLLVRVGELSAALSLETVNEVVPAAELGDLPEAPDWVLGLLNVRGSIVPVVDLRARLQGRAPELALGDLIVIVATRLGSAGLAVEEVENVVLLQRAELESSLHEAPHASYVLGTFSRAGRTTVLLGVPELLRHVELPTLAASGAEP